MPKDGPGPWKSVPCYTKALWEKFMRRFSDPPKGAESPAGGGE